MNLHTRTCTCQACLTLSGQQPERTGTLHETAARLERVASRLEQAITALNTATSTPALREDERDR